MVEQYQLSEIKQVVADFWKEFGGPYVYAFHGEMGAGKTTFIHALCDMLEVRSAVGSPTFSIINEYDSSIGTLYHLDLYRLRSEEEAQRAGVEDCLYSGAPCFVEWPEKAPGLFPDKTIHVHINLIGTDKRAIQVDRS